MPAVTVKSGSGARALPVRRSGRPQDEVGRHGKRYVRVPSRCDCAYVVCQPEAVRSERGGAEHVVGPESSGPKVAAAWILVKFRPGKED